MNSITPKLTQFSKSSGCGCKIDNSILKNIISGIGKSNNKFPNLMVANGGNDDAAILELNDGNLLVSTTDFFSPLVDDPFEFGRIAAANSISDVYAMGGNPILAVAILGWPISKLDASLAAEVLRGAEAVCSAANFPLAGGHTIENSEPFFGLAVNGILKKSNLKTNSNAKIGDSIFITKPLGLGVLSSAIKRELINEADYNLFIDWSTKLNSIGADLSNITGVNALTDITGFGFLGHLSEMAQASKLSAKIVKNDIPILESAKAYANQFVYPDITTKNYNNYKDRVKGLDGLDFINLCDPQTNGGLLISVNQAQKQLVLDLLRNQKIDESCLKEIGTFIEKDADFDIELI